MSPPMMTRLAVWHRSLTTGVRLYRRTPEVLRRPTPAARIAAALFVLWFGGMFLALGVLTSRSFTAGTAPLPPAVFHAYFVAAALGMIGLVGLLIRRYRLGLGLVIGMLALGQVVTVAAVL